MKRIRVFAAIIALVLTGLLAGPACAADLAEIEARLTAFADQSGSADMAARAVTRANGDYSFGIVIPYYTSDAKWGTDVVVTNLSDQTASCLIGVMDTDGTITAQGTFGLSGNFLRQDSIEAFLASGSVPVQGRIAIFSDQDFMVNRFIGTSSTDFSEWIFEAEPY